MVYFNIPKRESERNMTKEAIGKCSLCGGVYTHWGNNPEPLKRIEERCCDDCNATKVIPARLVKIR